MCPKRQKNDINDVLQSQEILQSIGVTASLAPDDEPDGRRHLVATIEGPQDTFYEGEVYMLDVLLSQGYPFDPPQMIFATEIDHPHVCQETGQVNLVRALFVVYRILSAIRTRLLTLFIVPISSGAKEWSPSGHCTLLTALFNIHSLLEEGWPVPANPPS